jgi:DNA repair exonuclease SbcCD nuclease subunit
MHNIADEEGCEAYVNIGDTFHVQEGVKTKFFNSYWRFCESIFEDHYIVVGNHDCPIKSNTKVNAMIPFGKIRSTYVMDEISNVETCGVNLIFIPYRESLEDSGLENHIIEGKKNYVFAHVAIEGAKMNSVKRSASGVNLKMSDFDFCFFGHFHTRQEIKENAWYIGSLTQQNWNLADCPTGFAIFDTDTNEIEFKDLGSIKHHKIQNDDDLTQDKIKGNCLRISVNGQFSPQLKERIIQDLKDKGALDVKIDFSNQVTNDDGKIEKLEDHIDSTHYYMEKVIEESDTMLNPEELMQIGLECLEQDV